MKQKNKGITLIALVITIIVLLILAAVSIATLTGENGILTKAITSKENSEKAGTIEQAKIDILAWQTEQMSKGQSAELSDDIIKGILTGKDYVKGEPGDTSFISKKGEHVIEYSELYESLQTTPTGTFNPETLEIGTAINSDKYGWQVTGYTKTTDEFTTGVWKLFYQDSNYTYLITDECVGRYKTSDYYTTVTNEDEELKYQTGADVGTIGQKLNKMLLDAGTFFVESNTNVTIRATAWLTDTESEIWKQYKNEDAVFAIGGPTVELYKASFDATASANGATTFSLEARTYGYDERTTIDQLKTTYNYGIYNKSTSSYWWIASPDDINSFGGLYMAGNHGYLGASDVGDSVFAVRPIVCIPTSVFDSKYASTLSMPTATFELGEAINSEKYGWKVTGYTKTTDEFTTGVWRLFYQDNNYTYLITDECVGSYKPSDYYTTVTKEDGELKYQTGADVSVVGQKLNKKLLDAGTFFVEGRTGENLRSVAWLTDTEAEIWKQYKNEDAVFAIGSPTAELYKASFDATASANNATTFSFKVGTYGYDYETSIEQLKTTYNYGIYTKGTTQYWWLASPLYPKPFIGMYIR